MTLAQDRPTTFASRTVDMRCGALAPGARPDRGARRCQLWSGHGPDHALMFADTEHRHVAVWRSGDAAAAPAPGDWRMLAWMRGFPVPAWFDTDTDADTDADTDTGTDALVAG